MGVFLPDHDINTSKLIKYWCAEGFIEDMFRSRSHSPKVIGMKYLVELVSNSVVLVRQQSTQKTPWGRAGIKKCGVHYIFQDFLIAIARKENLFHIGKILTDTSAEKIKDQCRLCIQNNVLFGIRDARDSMELASARMRSVLCTGPYHHYPVPIIGTGFWLLRVLDALTIRFYDFPVEVLKLFNLRHLAIIYNGKLPPSISKLWNLRCLIVYRHFSINSYGAQPYLPAEIWNMKELRHLQVTGDALPNPCGASLLNLEILLDTSVYSCTKEVFKCIPKLEKLGIQIELAPDRVENSCFLDHLIHLENLKSLKCIVVNPELRSPVVAPTDSFPVSLEKITLSGCGFSWEHMIKIAALPNLKVLKLRNYAFQGAEWEISEGNFRELEVLILEDSDLTQWRAESIRPIPELEKLNIRHCYKLEELPYKYEIEFPNMIELVDPKRSLVDYVERYTSWKNFEVHVHRSWDDKKLKS